MLGLGWHIRVWAWVAVGLGALAIVAGPSGLAAAVFCFSRAGRLIER